MKKKVVSLTLCIAMVAAMITGCGSTQAAGSAAPAEDATEETATEETAEEAPAEEASGDTINIGVVAPLTGGYALFGESGKNSVELAVKQLNEAGGVLGKQINIVEYVDDKGDSTEAVNAYNRLVSQDISAVVGTFSSSCTIPMAERAQEEGMLLITPSATNAKVTLVGDHIFRACFIDPIQGPMMAKFAYDEGMKKAAVIYAKDDDYSNGLYESISEAWSGFDGAELVYTGECTSKDADFTAQVSQVVASGAEVLFYPFMLDTVPLVVQQAREAGFEGMIVGGDGWDGSETSGIESYFNNTYYTNHYAPEDPAEKVQAYVAAYKEAYGEDTLTSIGACYYDALMMVAQAMETAGSAESEDVVKAMTGMSFEGVTGSFTLDENGDPKKPITFVEFVDGVPTWKANVEAE
ncbi:MAG: ABC transporter substrate-binding protein [Lachnospiraceae bacterium]|nr:ABC transporter substrate-binding protein [Lachnospiraceae bacterium]